MNSDPGRDGNILLAAAGAIGLFLMVLLAVLGAGVTASVLFFLYHLAKLWEALPLP